mgnify:CR=1 FL=1
MKPRVRTNAFRLLLLSTLTLPSCVTPIDLAANASLGVAQAGSSTFIQGTLAAAFARPMDEVADAVRRAMDRLNYPLTHERTASNATMFDYGQSDGSSIAIRTRRSSPTVTILTIRAGFWGEHALSRLILSEVERELERASTPG